MVSSPSYTIQLKTVSPKPSCVAPEHAGVSPELTGVLPELTGVLPDQTSVLPEHAGVCCLDCVNGWQAVCIGECHAVD